MGNFRMPRVCASRTKCGRLRSVRTPPHDRGSHSGTTRIFRTAYAEHPDYVPLAVRAGVLWDRFGTEQGTVLLHRTGMLSLGSPDSPLLCGVRASAAAHHLTIENLTRSQIRSNFSVFDVPIGWEGVLERSAGWIDVNETLRLGLEQASRAGAALHINTRVEGWSWTGNGFAVRTSAGTFVAAHLIVRAGFGGSDPRRSGITVESAAQGSDLGQSAP